MAIEIDSATSPIYTAVCTLGPSQVFKEVQFVVSAPNSATYQLAKSDVSGIVYWDENELTAQPGYQSYQGIYGIRFRSWQGSSTPTNVLAQGYFEDDPIPQGFISGTGSFADGSSVSPGGTGINGLTGIIAADGAILAGTGFTVAQVPGEGIWDITFNTALTTAPIVIGSILDYTTDDLSFVAPGGDRGSLPNATGFRAISNGSEGTTPAHPWNFIVIVPQ